MTRITLIIIALLLQSCLFSSKVMIRGKGNIKLEQSDFNSLEGWEKGDQKKALQAFLHSCNKFAKMPQNRLIGGQIGNITVGDFRDICDIAEVVKTMSTKQTRNFFENWFRVFEVSKKFGGSEGVFTGYYEASLNGSRTKTAKYKYPVYGKPKDLNSDAAYLSRAQIEEGALQGKGLEILYVDDPVELFFMHIQGSGRVELPNGRVVRVGYAARNNQPFTAISSPMVDAGYLEPGKANAVKIKEWLKANPDKAQEVMNINSAYTFFAISNNEHVVGAQNVPLTPYHSLAVDKSIIPYGLPIWVDTTIKVEDKSRKSFNKLMISQDTGSAIKGTIRGDIFFGYGKEAEKNASYMASRGKYYILLPINIVDKLLGR